MAQNTDPKEARKASLKDALDGTETDVPLAKKDSVDPAPTVAPIATAGLSPDVLALMQTLATAITSNQQAQNDSSRSMMEQFAAMMAEQTRIAREPIPENKVAPNVSAFNPAGERDNPRPGLKCHMYLGQYDEEGKIEVAYPVVEDACTVDEQAMCNSLEQGEATVDWNDGRSGRVLIQARRDGAGKLNRIVIALPYGRMSKEFHHTIPPFKRLLTQILEQQAVAA